MADTAVGFLLENLKQLLVYNAHLILEAKDQVTLLYEDLKLLVAFLKDSTEKRNQNEFLKELVNQIRDVVYEAEDAIDAYIAQAVVRKSKGPLEKAFNIFNYPAKISSLAVDIGKIRAKVKDIYDKKTFGFEYQDGDGSEPGPKEKKDPVVEEDNVIGFDEEAINVINLLTDHKCEDLQVISIFGMPGLGKTTLAKMIYRDSKVEFNFYNRAWVYVSEKYSRKEVFLAIFRNFTQVTDAMHNMDANTLAKELCKYLETSRYLIVLDDVWTEEAWNDLKIAFPKNNKKSRILITSRNKKVGLIANPKKEPYALRFLTLEESWRLLQWKALGSEFCPVELMRDGMHIANECGGLPLAIVVIGGILLEKGVDWWGKVAKCVEAYMAMDESKRMDKLVALSYNHLPYHLKSCFIYFGMFPENFEIPVWKLVRLWIAEGFIQHQQRNKGMSLEDIAVEYLDDLVNRSLVMAGDRKLNGNLKTCHVHDMLHEFCKNTASEENFFHEIRGFNQDTYATSNPALEKYRRLCIHSDVIKYISSKPVGLRVRSFLSFSLEEIKDSKRVSSILVAFKLLRVLDAPPIHFNNFPADLTILVHLRYIFLSSSFNIIPPALSTLWNIQTFLVQTTSRTLEIKADIWKMIKLRHVKTNALATLPKKNKDDKMVICSLQTLSMISPESCTDDVFVKAPNLQSLGVRGQLSKLLESKGGNLLFDSLGKLIHLENLKLCNDVFPRPPSKGKLAMLPTKSKFPPQLKKLTLSDTLLDWKEMSVLGMLDYLEILKLKDNAFEGELWQPEDGGFRRLKVLHVEKTNLVRWHALAHHFPILKRLFLRHCSNLEELPASLGDISSLELIDLFRTTKAAAQSAKCIQDKKQNQSQQSARGGGFKLSIYPPDM